MAFFLFNEQNAKALLMMRKGDVMTIITNFLLFIFTSS